MRLGKSKCSGVIFSKDTARIEYLKRIDLIDDLEQFWFLPRAFAQAVIGVRYADHGPLIAQPPDSFFGAKAGWYGLAHEKSQDFTLRRHDLFAHDHEVRREFCQFKRAFRRVVISDGNSVNAALLASFNHSVERDQAVFGILRV